MELDGSATTDRGKRNLARKGCAWQEIFVKRAAAQPLFPATVGPSGRRQVARGIAALSCWICVQSGCRKWLRPSLHQYRKCEKRRKNPVQASVNRSP